jgi:large subunit ribosomal protein L25
MQQRRNIRSTPVSEVKISAEPRTEFGKGGARRTRRAGKVPAVLYGHGEKPVHIALPAREFAAAIRHGGLNQIFAIDVVGSSTTLALAKAIQRDPIKDTFEHVDLLIVKRGEKVTVDVPVQLTGEAARGTLVVTESNTLSIIAEALHLPDHLEVSIEGLEGGSRDRRRRHAAAWLGAGRRPRDGHRRGLRGAERRGAGGRDRRGGGGSRRRGGHRGAAGRGRRVGLRFEQSEGAPDRAPFCA